MESTPTRKRKSGIQRYAPFIIAGTLKCLYDLLLYRSFSGIETPEERASKA